MIWCLNYAVFFYVQMAIVEEKKQKIKITADFKPLNRRLHFSTVMHHIQFKTPFSDRLVTMP